MIDPTWQKGPKQDLPYLISRIGTANIRSVPHQQSHGIPVYSNQPCLPEKPTMALATEDIEFIKQHMGEWLAEQTLGKPPAVYELELRERMVRVEEELKHQRELMKQGFDMMEKRFEQVEKRFEQVDKRFEQVERRFEQVDKRFESLEKRMDNFMHWSFDVTLTVGGLVVAAIKYLP
jgi:hypothetical protein